MKNSSLSRILFSALGGLLLLGAATLSSCAPLDDRAEEEPQVIAPVDEPRPTGRPGKLWVIDSAGEVSETDVWVLTPSARR